MNRSTISSSFPDVNVWLAVLLDNHIHRPPARAWWAKEENPIVFTRFTQLGVLRLLTTAAAMDRKPLSMDEAWRAYDRLFEDDRVVFHPEPREVDQRFREVSAGAPASPRVWADAWLLAVSQTAGGVLVTFDGALAARAFPHSLHLKSGAPA